MFGAFKQVPWLYLHNFTRLHHREFYDLKTRLPLISQEPDNKRKGREEKRPAPGGQVRLPPGRAICFMGRPTPPALVKQGPQFPT